MWLVSLCEANVPGARRHKNLVVPISISSELISKIDMTVSLKGS